MIMKMSCKLIMPIGSLHPQQKPETIDLTRVSGPGFVTWTMHRNDFYNRIYLEDFYHLL
jgi:hypothetical protein